MGDILRHLHHAQSSACEHSTAPSTEGGSCTHASAMGDGQHPDMPLTYEDINSIADSMPGGLDGFMKGWGWQQFARAVQAKSLESLVSKAQETARHQLLNTPELKSFADGVILEALHQRDRWSGQDTTKSPGDWAFLIGHLCGKAVQATYQGDIDKAMHHTITAAAALANWHAHIAGTVEDVGAIKS